MIGSPRDQLKKWQVNGVYIVYGDCVVSIYSLM